MTNTTGPTHALLTGPFGQTKRPRRASALLLGTALGAIVGMGYGRGAYAQGVPQSGDLSTSNTATVEITGPGTFETQDGFSVDTSGGSGNGITISTADNEIGNTTFTDSFQSGITGDESGISALNEGNSALTITTTGLIDGKTGIGIFARNGDYLGGTYEESGKFKDYSLPRYDPAGTDLKITANGDVSGYNSGIAAYNTGTGATQIEVTGSVSATRTDTRAGAIVAHNREITGTYLRNGYLRTTYDPAGTSIK